MTPEKYKLFNILIFAHTGKNDRADGITKRLEAARIISTSGMLVFPEGAYGHKTAIFIDPWAQVKHLRQTGFLIYCNFNDRWAQVKNHLRQTG